MTLKYPTYWQRIVDHVRNRGALFLGDLRNELNLSYWHVWETLKAGLIRIEPQKNVGFAHKGRSAYDVLGELVYPSKRVVFLPENPLEGVRKLRTIMLDYGMEDRGIRSSFSQAAAEMFSPEFYAIFMEIFRYHNNCDRYHKVHAIRERGMRYWVKFFDVSTDFALRKKVVAALSSKLKNQTPDILLTAQRKGEVLVNDLSEELGLPYTSLSKIDSTPSKIDSTSPQLIMSQEAKEKISRKKVGIIDDWKISGATSKLLEESAIRAGGEIEFEAMAFMSFPDDSVIHLNIGNFI